MVKRQMLWAAAALAAVAVLGSCAGKAPSDGGLPAGGIYKVGKPYQVNGVWYYPAEDFTYDDTGIASWYGPGFHTKATANGEPYDENELTAAHKTLPLPSLVRVTNLDNGRAIVVRINDRGPFAAGRVIDLSRRGAQLLGFEQTGTAKVRVQILADESRAIAAAARRNTPSAILAEQEGPAPRAAPRPSVQVGDAPAATAPARDLPPLAPPNTVAGNEVDGRFLPSAQVAEVPVRKIGRIYIQAGAFTVAGNADRLRSRLAPIGPSQVSTATVNGQRFYRVRLGPLADVQTADSTLTQVFQAGLADAKIVVD